MSDVMAIDIETENFSHEIGGWGNTHMFSPTVVATWTGDGGTVYCNKSQAVGSWDTTSSALTYLC